jgi:MFS family permease
MSEYTRRNLKFNILINLADGGTFGFALGFVSFSTILPLFVSSMTDSAILVGLVPAIHNIGWMFPQLFTSKNVSRLPLLKPNVLVNTINERLPIFFLVAVAWSIPTIGKTAALILTFLLLVWQGLGAGITANAWQNMIGKIIPADILATFFGLQAAASNLLASVGAILAGYLLEKYPGPQGFAYSFIVASAILFIGWFFLKQTREEAIFRETTPADETSLWQMIVEILRTNKPFTWFLISRILYYFSMMAFAFFMVYAVRKLGMSEIEAGLLTSVLLITQMVANITLGRIADKWSRKGVMEIGAVASLLSCALAWLAKDANWFYPVIILEGIANTAFWTIGLPILMEFGTEEQRPTFVGLGNTLIAPAAILSPILGGWLADSAGYPVAFLISAIIGLSTIFILHFFVKDPRPRRGHIPPNQPPVG